MSDDLVKRLRDASTEALQAAWRRTDGGQDLALGAILAEQAADRIEELEANAMKASNAAFLQKRRADEAEAKLAKAVEAMRERLHDEQCPCNACAPLIFTIRALIDKPEV
jgi:hypothetical protein